MGDLGDPLRHHTELDNSSFGIAAERFAKFFGTPAFLISQTLITIGWIVLNVCAFKWKWDPAPFMLLNFCYTIQSGYAAPLILLAQARQAERDKACAEADANHREELAGDTHKLLKEVLDKLGVK